MQEATVVSNAYSGQYGQQAGAQVNYVTKSGTNQFHGNAEYWWTGRAMDANDWFNNLNGTPRPFANNNEWAASLGGPIKKDKLFFFVDTEGIRYIVPSTHAGVLADAELRQRDAWRTSRQPIRLRCRSISKIFNLYPDGSGLQPQLDRVRPAATVVAGLRPGFRSATASASIRRRLRCRATEWILSGRVDYNLSDKDHLFWRVRMDHGTQATVCRSHQPGVQRRQLPAFV